MNKLSKLSNLVKNRKVIASAIVLAVVIVGVSSYAAHSRLVSTIEKPATSINTIDNPASAGTVKEDITSHVSGSADDNKSTNTTKAATTEKSEAKASTTQSSQPATPNVANQGSKNVSASTGGTTTIPNETFPNNSFAVSKGNTSKSYGQSTITHTFTILITPTYAKFGTPTINARLSGSPGSDNYACQNRGAVVSKTYDASRSISVNCVVTRVYPSEPGQSPAPLQSQALVRIYVDGLTSTGIATNGGMLEYVLDYGYDR